MAKVVVEYGPPGEKGVSHIMGVGADELAELDATEKTLQRSTWLGLGMWFVGVVTDKPTLRGVGIGAAAVGIGGRIFGK